ncbi:MAG: PKD domain-containing protein [Verrucomicrobiota bacterium]
MKFRLRLIAVGLAVAGALFYFQFFRDPQPSNAVRPAQPSAATPGSELRSSGNALPALSPREPSQPGIPPRNQVQVPALAVTRPNLEPSNAQAAFSAFADWTRRYVAAETAGARVSLEAEGVALARKRRDEMLDLIQSHPQQALAGAISGAQRAALPAAIQEWIEQEVSGRGDLEVIAALPEPGREAEVKPLERFAIIDGRRYAAFVFGRRRGEPTLRNTPLHGVAIDSFIALSETPPQLEQNAFVPNGAQENTSGADASVIDIAQNPAAELDPSLAQRDGHHNHFHTASAGSGGGSGVLNSAATEGLKRIILIRVDFSDLAGEPFSASRGATLITNLHTFFSEMSYGRSGFRMVGDGSAVTPVLRLPRTAASYGNAQDAGGLRNDARNAARNAGYTLTNYDYDVICLGSVPGFGWAGLGYVGAPGAWIRGTSSTGVTAHELGHNYGLNHANYWDTRGESVTGSGTEVEYGDKFDTMGAASAGNNHFNARYKELLDWLRAGEYQVVTTNGLYRMFAHDLPQATGVRGLQIFLNSQTNYWLEFRQKFAANKWLMNGAGLRWSGRGNESAVLLDTTPGSAAEKDDSPIVLGRTYADPAAGIFITPIRKGGTTPESLDVVIQRGHFPSNQPPTISLTASATNGTTSTTFTFRTAAIDPDGDALAYFWDFGDAELGANLATVTHRWATAGDYVVSCTASDMKGGVATASIVVRVGSPGTFRVSGRVTADGEPVLNARVSAGSGRVAFTDSDGRYTLTGLARGLYNLVATSEKYRFERFGFMNPLNVTTHFSGADFVSVDAADREQVTLLPAGAIWSYWDKGTLPASNWKDSAYDHSTWDKGAAILGYGGDRETTEISYGANPNSKFITAWFRRQFVVEDPSTFLTLTLGLLRDDGAVVYLNGREVFRSNMPTGTIGAATLASATVGGADETTYFETEISPALLQAGTNVFAVEVHQASATSSDTAFDLRLAGDRRVVLPSGLHLVRPAATEVFTAPARVVLAAAAGELGGSALARVTFSANGSVVGVSTNTPFRFVWTNVLAGLHTIEAIGEDTSGNRWPAGPLLVQVNDPNLSPTLVSRGSIWRYLDDGSNAGIAWRDPDFNDAQWAFGPARFGYGEDGEFTVLNYGSNPDQKFVTTYFRHRFHVSDAGSFTNLLLRVVRDDAVAVYLNGQEIFRNNLLSTISYTTLATAEVTGDAEQAWIERTIAATALVDGANVLAAELHQYRRNSSDLGFDLELAGARKAKPSVPAPRLEWNIGTGFFEISWPATAGDWKLMSTSNLDPNPVWVEFGIAPVAADGRLRVTVPLENAARFFRLESR